MAASSREPWASPPSRFRPGRRRQRPVWRGAGELLGPALALMLAACDAGTPSTHSPTAPPSASTPARRGEDIHESCRLCHSTREMQRGPILDGLPAWYVEEQLRKFRLGWRGRNETNRSELLMGSTLGLLASEAEEQAVASHIESLPVPEHLWTVPGDASQGQLIYTACATCHGDRAQGDRERFGPPLSGLEDWYLLDQLRKFKSRARGYHPADTNGVQMATAVQSLSDENLRDVVHYIARLAPKAAPSPNPPPEASKN